MLKNKIIQTLYSFDKYNENERYFLSSKKGLQLKSDSVIDWISWAVDTRQDKHNPYNTAFTESSSKPTQKMKQLMSFLGILQDVTLFLLFVF